MTNFIDGKANYDYMRENPGANRYTMYEGKFSSDVDVFKLEKHLVDHALALETQVRKNAAKKKEAEVGADSFAFPESTEKAAVETLRTLFGTKDPVTKQYYRWRQVVGDINRASVDAVKATAAKRKITRLANKLKLSPGRIAALKQGQLYDQSLA